MKLIQSTDLVDIAAVCPAVRVDLIYADANHPLNQTFKTAIYRPQAKMWIHKDLARIVIRAAERAAGMGYKFILTDSLRTVEAQARMADTPIVKANPHWKNVLLSTPGQGAHPRGMAVDIMLEGVDMGTPLDYFSTDPHDNPAARNYPHAPEILANRQLLEDLMMDAARAKGFPLLPLQAEWWDFRFPPNVYEQYAPLSDSDLPPEMRMCS